MTREIKFRAWDGERMFLSPSEIQHLGSWFDGHWPGALAKPDQIRLMQYTGLHDKNGVEIYEGDIVMYRNDYDGDWESSPEPHNDFALVHWDNDYAAFRLDDSFFKDNHERVNYYSFEEGLELEIIGNRFDDIRDFPELLSDKVEAVK